MTLMLRFIFRWLWRTLILLLGIGILVFLVQVLWPDNNSRVTIFFVSLVIYCLMAYLVIPTLFRIYRVLAHPNHIPLYVTTVDGWPADPVNIAVVARNEKQFIKAMQQAGWYTADKATFKNSLREGWAILFNRPYPNAPFSTLFLFDKPFDIGFQKPANSNMSPRSRHHVRFWKLDAIPDAESGTASHIHISFWHNHLRHLLGLDKQVWIGAAIDDTGPIGLRWRNGQITHKNNPDTNAERDLIISDLDAAGQVYSTETIQAGEPFKFHGQTLGNKFLCDGTIKVIGIHQPIVAKLKQASRGKKPTSKKA